MAAQIINERLEALNIIMFVLEENKFSHIILRNNLKEITNKNPKITKKNKAFITRLSEGTIEKKITLDYVLNKYSKIKVSKMKPYIRNILRMSLYQFYFMDSVPQSAICNEAVKLAKKKGYESLSGFVNGVLRNIFREMPIIVYPDCANDDIEYLSVRYSMPTTIIEHFISHYGIESTKNILEGLQLQITNSETALRVNISKSSVSETIEMLKKQNITVRRTPIYDNAILISNYQSIEEIEAFQKGYLQVQDLSSMLVGAVSGVKKNNYCLDVCAAPGGKSMHIADLLMETGHVESCDVSQKKVHLINENIQRSGFRNIRANVSDALVFHKEYYEKADVVIADVPCSGLGVMGKKTDIKYHINHQNLQEIAILSQNILKNVIQYVKKGGTFVFSTCTINPIENELNREYILRNFDMEPISIEEDLADEILNMGNNKEDAKKGFVQIYPSKYMDGFFIAKFRKRV